MANIPCFSKNTTVNYYFLSSDYKVITKYRTVGRKYLSGATMDLGL